MLTHAARLAAEVDTFATLVEDLRAIAARSDPSRRGELIALRRELATQIARMRDSGMSAFADREQCGEFRSRLSHALKLMALHQTKWPAVSIDRDNAAYRESAQQLAEANHSFINWTRAALAMLR